MVQLIGIQAKRLEKCIVDGNSTERSLFDQWSTSAVPSEERLKSYFMRYDDEHYEFDPFVAKLVYPKSKMGYENEVVRGVVNVIFLFKRKGALYCERMNISEMHNSPNWKRYAQVETVWNRIKGWVLDGEIEPDDDIVIYRTGGRRSSKIHNKYPLRLKDNTYCFMTGIAEYLPMCYDWCKNREFDGVPVPDFDQFFEDSMYRGHIHRSSDNVAEWSRRRFFYNGSQFVGRSRWLYYYFATYGEDIKSIFSEMGVRNQRMNFLLWNDGKIRVWESSEEDPEVDGDHFHMLTYDDGHVKWNLKDSDYKWTNDDYAFKLREENE